MVTIFLNMQMNVAEIRGEKMIYINFIAILTVVVFCVLYQRYIEKGFIGNYGSRQLFANKMQVRTVMLIALVVKLLTSAIYYGFGSDMGCFYGWSHDVVNNGLSHFYYQDFADYPPGYVYILYILGLIIKVFNIQSGTIAAAIILKAPAVICDVAAGYFIYRIARKSFTERTALLCFFLYVFNPAIYINSSVWGQVDSVHTLFAIYMLYCLTKEKYSKAIMSFAVGLLIKPQTAFFLPILVFVCFKGAFLKKEENRTRFAFNAGKFTNILLWAVIGIETLFVLILPFGIGKVFNQYFNTLGSYEFGSVNAYNIWTLFGQNWMPQTNTLFGIPFTVYGYGAIVIAVILSGVFYYKAKCKEETKIYLSAAFLIITIFMFSVRMHERYMYPALVLLFVAFLTKPNKKMFIAYLLMSVAHFYNVGHVLFYYDGLNYDWQAAVPKTISLFTIIVYGVFLYAVYLYFIDDQKTDLKEPEPKTEETKDEKVEDNMKKHTITAPSSSQKKKTSKKNKNLFLSDEKSRFTKKDWLIMLAITIVYALIAFYNLGYNYAPETDYTIPGKDQTIEFDFPNNTNLSKISVYNGNIENREFKIERFDVDSGEWVRIAANESESKYPVLSSVFKWNSIDLTLSCDGTAQDTFDKSSGGNAPQTSYVTGSTNKIRLTTESQYYESVLKEMVFLDQDGIVVMPLNTLDYPELFDEQDLYDPTESYRSGTYFDEIYHARTGYEFLKGLPTYEWTHPPLGKILIALGMSIFGVNPFGWRFMGTLFGVLMLPLIFVFARKFFKKTWIAGVTCLLFAVDFMHFAQTRIATIDVFVTFFILLMYYFMYQYTTVSYYDQKLYKSFIPLGLSGITMGLAIASKVTGVYAAVGLAVIFFADLYHRYKEYRYACSDPEGTTNGITHSSVMRKFRPNTIKTILFCVLVFIVIPFIIYTLSYIPFIDKYGPSQGLVARMWKNQGDMFEYHANLNATHSFSSTWYQWPIIWRPIWYFSRNISPTMAEGISSFGNPLIWWAGIPAFFGTIYYAFRDKDRKGAFLIIGYIAQYLPWMLVTRCTFIYHYFPSVPFVVLMVAYCIYHLMTKHKVLKPWIITFVVACVVLFFMFYPVLSGMTINKWYVNHFLRWFDGWVLLSK